MRRFVLVSALLLAMAPPAVAGKGKKRGKVIDRVAIVVDGEPIFESDIARRVRFGGTRADAETQLIDEALFVGYARAHAVAVTPDEVDLAIEEIQKQNQIDAAQLDAALKEQGFTLAEYRLEVERQLLLLRTRNVIKSDRDPDTWLVDHRDHAFIDRRVAP